MRRFSSGALACPIHPMLTGKHDRVMRTYLNLQLLKGLPARARLSPLARSARSETYP